MLAMHGQRALQTETINRASNEHFHLPRASHRRWALQARFHPTLHTLSASQPNGDLKPSSWRTLHVTSSAPSSSTPAVPAQPLVVDIPDSQQAAVDNAAQCLVPALQPHLAVLKTSKTARGFSNSSKPGAAGNRFGIEIPVLESSARAVVDLTGLVIAATAARIKQRSGAAAAAAVAPTNWTIVHARDDAAQLARSRSGGGGSGGQVLGLRQACQQPQLGGLLLVVEPSVSDVALVEQLLEEVWAGPAAVVLNPQWSQQGVQLPAEYERVAASIEVLYSFLPCAIQGLLGPKEGAVLRTVETGAAAAAGAPWRILLKEGDQFVQVGAMPRRPASSDLELAFMNAAAASSPLTKTAKFLRGLIPGGKK